MRAVVRDRYRDPVPATSIGPLLKTWRSKRAVSQLELAINAGVSPRHLSFVETGRAKPSPELVLALAAHLDVPLRDRNTLLLAAGYAPRFSNVPLDSDAMTAITASLRRLLDAHDPFPGVILDLCWNVVHANNAATRLLSMLPSDLVEPPPVNMFRASLHPDGLAAVTTNFDTWGDYLLRQLDRAAASNTPALTELQAEIASYPNVAELRAGRPKHDQMPNDLVLTCNMNLGGHAISLFTTLTTFGTPHDITLDELVIELFFPADHTTEQHLRTM